MFRFKDIICHSHKFKKIMLTWLCWTYVVVKYECWIWILNILQFIIYSIDQVDVGDFVTWNKKWFSIFWWFWQVTLLFRTDITRKPCITGWEILTSTEVPRHKLPWISPFVKCLFLMVIIDRKSPWDMKKKPETFKLQSF